MLSQDTKSQLSDKGHMLIVVYLNILLELGCGMCLLGISRRKCKSLKI